MKQFTNIFPLLVCLLVSSCATSPEAGDCKPENQEVKPGELDVIICESQRPEACTREDDPVCASLTDGGTRSYARSMEVNRNRLG